MGIREGVLLRADCGAEVMYVQGCPDDAVGAPVCACGAEFVAVEADASGGGAVPSRDPLG